MNVPSKRERRRSIAKQIAAGEKSRRALEGAPSERTEAVPEWILQAVRRTEAETSPGKLPVTVLRNAGTSVGDAVVVVRLSSWLRHFGERLVVTAEAMADRAEREDG